MLEELRRRWLIPAGIAILGIVADQLTKSWIVDTLGPLTMSKRIAVLGDLAGLVYHHNTGVAFGLFPGMSNLFTVTSLLITFGALYFYRTQLPHDNRWVQVSIGLIAAGGIGNAIDRIRLGYVVDFISIGWFPIFNIADSCITVGVILLAITLLFGGDPEKPQQQPRDEALLKDLLNRENWQPKHNE